MNRKRLSLVLLASLALGLPACANGGGSSSTESEPTPTSSTNPFNPVPVDYEPVHPDGWELKLKQPTNALAEGFAYGVDASTVLEVEQGGGKFYVQENGQWKEKELFRALADGGATHARIRIWNDPYDALGNRYGGGTNSVDNDIIIARRAQQAGLKVMLDFHYSDSWADPGKYYVPKMWANESPNDIPDKVYDFTKESLQKFYDAGISVAAVQVGNEINPGIAGLSSANYSRLSKLIANGIKAVKEVYPEAKSIVHYTDILYYSTLFTRVGYLKKYKALPDIIGLSYYPYWHGSLENLQMVCDTLATDYGTEVQVVETAWGFSDDWNDWSNNQYSSSTYGEAGGYETSPQGQASVLADIIDVLSKVPNHKGTGIYYWEPAWLPNEYSGWITNEGLYYNEHGVDWTTKQTPEQHGAVGGVQKSAWSNQALFDYEGKALDSLYTYYHIAKGDKFVEERLTTLRDTEMSQTINLAEEWSLPTTVRAYTNLGASRNVEVTWNAEEVAAITSAGYYTVHGTALGQEVVINVKAAGNFILESGFEGQGCTSGNEVTFKNDPWTLETTHGYKVDQGDAWVEAKNELGGQGNQYLHWYTSSTPLEFTLSQNLGTVPAGEYELGFTTRSSWHLGGGGAAPYDNYEIQVTINGDTTVYDCKQYTGNADNGGYVEQLVAKITLNDASSVAIAFVVKTSSGGAWGNADDFFFSAVIPE